MKKSIMLLLLLLSLESYSQITLDFQTSEWSNIYIKLSNVETKYMSYDLNKINTQNQFELFNLDGSLFKTINLPLKPNPSAGLQQIWYISRSLFDTDTSNIEFLVSYSWDSSFVGSYSEIDVVREDGTILLNEFHATADYWPSNFNETSVFPTEYGTKLRLTYFYANGKYYQTKVFNLPGKLPNSVQEEMNAMNDNPIIFPNPNNGSFFIVLRSKGGDANILDLYTGNGKLIDTYKSNETQIFIDRCGLSDGLYLLNNRSRKMNSTTKMIIEK